MLTKLKCKCIFGFLWTSAIAAGILTFIVFTFIDPGEIAEMMGLVVDVTMLRLKSYAGVFIFIWFLLNTSIYLNCYFNQLANKADQETDR